ncbi:HAD family phosphatase [Synechococcus sp. LTW-R]|uniref:HAD family hydrolase n=1 Tax=Synechococcus sp. LTW-R TaxID=2751170 RepID=UPI00162AC330|nr:HAD family phosphatase [Synechococcus sp. LTW-R]QNG30103.1 HAD family phosphatase [Synechococcus sp. LTW-R]
MAHPAACLFDLDGLLLDTEPLHAEAWQRAAQHFGRELTDGELMQLRGRRRLDCADQVRLWIGAGGLEVPSPEDLLAIRQPIAEALLIQAQPMAGAQALVQRCLDLALPMALATSSSREAVLLKAQPHPWLEAIQERVHGDDPELKRGKPHPDVFQLAAQRLGVNCADSWAFEDSPAGAEAALAAGCRVFVVPAPGADRKLYPGKGTEMLTSLVDVLPLLEGTPQ